MKTLKEDKYTLYTLDKDDQKDSQKVLMDIDANQNAILDCSSINIDEELSSLLSASYESFVIAQKSFVVVISEKEDMEAFEELFVVVPTISEAIDYLYMEELERNF